MPTTDLPATLTAVAGYLRDACDGPDDGADACETAAAIVRAAGDPEFMEAMRSVSRDMRHSQQYAERGGLPETAASFRRDAETIDRVLALIAEPAD